jgi:hypothetical protein
MHCVSPAFEGGDYVPAFCAADPAPDPMCQLATAGYCKEETIVHKCRRGYRIAEIACARPAACFAVGFDAQCQSPRPGLACFDANVLLGSDAATHWVCSVRQAGGALDGNCPDTSLPGVPGGSSRGCCLGTRRCGILLESLAADGQTIGCIDAALLGHPSSQQSCGLSVDAGWAESR